jgi:hypothetical protein
MEKTPRHKLLVKAMGELETSTDPTKLDSKNREN